MRPSRLLLAASLTIALLVALAPAAVAGKSDRIVWVALEGACKLAKVDLGGGVLRRIDTRGGGPHNITVGPDGTVVASLWASHRIVIFRDGERRFVDLGGAPHDVKIARNRVVIANQATERIQLVKLDGTFIRRILLKADPQRPGDRPEAAARLGHARGHRRPRRRGPAGPAHARPLRGHRW